MCIIFATSLTAFASEDTTSFDAEEYISSQLNTWAEQNEIGISFDEVLITPINESVGEKEIEASAKSYVLMMKEALSNASTNVIEKPTLMRATATYTAKVESMVPAIGWGYINQDFKATVSSSKISSVSLVGNSYDTGFTLGAWEPNYSWAEISNNKQYLQIHMKGTLNYLWDSLNIAHSCTFLDTFKASGSSLVDSTYLDWPD